MPRRLTSILNVIICNQSAFNFLYFVDREIFTEIFSLKVSALFFLFCFLFQTYFSVSMIEDFTPAFHSLKQ